MNNNSNLPASGSFIHANESEMKRKRTRTAFTTRQLEGLEEEFRKCQFIVLNRRLQLAAELQLTEKTVKVWFQNRRMKEKKEKDRCNSTVDDNNINNFKNHSYVNNGNILPAAQPNAMPQNYLNAPPLQPALANGNGVMDFYENRYMVPAARPMEMQHFENVPLRQFAPVAENRVENYRLAAHGNMNPAGQNFQWPPFYDHGINQIEHYQLAAPYNVLPPAPQVQQEMHLVELPEEAERSGADWVRMAFNVNNCNDGS